MKDRNEFTISSVEVSVYSIPTDFPESDGTFEWNDTTIIIVIIHTARAKGIGYTYSHKAAAVLIENLFKPLLIDEDATNTQKLWNEMVHAIRNLGRQGLCSMAIAAVDNALWDLKARLLNVSLSELIGQAQVGIRVYGSGGFTSYSIDQLEKQFSEWSDQGIKMMKMKIGRDLEFDKLRIKAARNILDKNCELFIDANGAYTIKQALYMAGYASDQNVSWFEEPVVSDNLAGLKFIREHSPQRMNIAAGEYGFDSVYFNRMLESRAVDVLQIDATRCAGITGFLTAVNISEGFGIPNSAHTAPSIHLAPSCTSKNVLHIEYFHDHVRIEKMFFDGFIEPVDGVIIPRRNINGNGLELKSRDIEKFRIN